MLADKDLVDFHTHSTASDGTVHPFQVAINADRLGIKAVALTDHDCVTGIAGFLGAAPRLQLWAIGGVELSCQFEGRRLHLLGLGLRRTALPALEAFLAEVRSWREQRNARMVDRLGELGYPVTREEVAAFAGGEIVARPHFARALIARGHAESLADAFTRLIGRGCPGYVDKRRLTPAEGVAAIHEAGGLAICAHPNSLTEAAPGDLQELVRKLVEAGVDGIEAFHPDMPPELTAAVVDLAAKSNLLLSGGSDFHGRNKPDNHLGRVFGRRKLFAQAVRPLLERLSHMPRH